MRKTLLLASVITVVTSVISSAQTQAPQQKPGNRLGKGNMALTAGKGTGMESRLVGTTYWYYDGGLAPSDSTRYTYTGDRGWDFVFDDWKYDSGISWDYNGTSYEQAYRSSRSFDAGDRIVGELFEYFDGSAWGTESVGKYIYGGNGLITEDWEADYDGTDWDTTKNVYTYDAQGRLLTQLMSDYSYSVGQWENSVRFTNTFNASGNILSMVSEVWNSGTSSWDSSYRAGYTYTGNELTEMSSESYMGGNWIPASKTTYTYTGGKETGWESENWTGSAWVKSQRGTKTYNGAGDMITEVREMYDGTAYKNYYKQIYTYNGYHQALTEISQSWNNTSGQFEMQDGNSEVHNYYEEFNNAVPNVNAGMIKAEVFPVPARDMLYINITRSGAGTGTMALYDATGKQVRQLTLPGRHNFNKAVDVSGLAAGTYVLRISDAAGTTAKQVSITR